MDRAQQRVKRIKPNKGNGLDFRDVSKIELRMSMQNKSCPL
jgi:hypothetical protein